MRSCETDSGQSFANRQGPPIALLNKRTSTTSRSIATSCSVARGFGFRHNGLWARPRPGALYAQKTLARACASSPEISWGGHGILPSPMGLL
jgi:hypothetical protein